jgi:hypothetical protein
VHFSQTGKVFTRIRKQGVPLRKINGHVFTVMLQGLEGFEQVASEKDKHHHSLERTVVEYKTDASGPAFKFVALWQSLESFGKGLKLEPGKKIAGPWIIRRLEPTPSMGFALSPTDDNLMFGHILTLTIEVIPSVDKDNGSMITFIGGFDPVELVNDLKQPSSFLALVYPAKDPETLKATIGSIDYQST